MLFRDDSVGVCMLGADEDIFRLRTYERVVKEQTDR